MAKDTLPPAAGTAAAVRMPVYYLSHGGGPWSYMQGSFREMFRPLERSLQDIPRQLPALPKALLVITGHWQESVFSVSAGVQPGMIYDYSGFAEPLYRISYPAPGSPELAARVAELLRRAGWSVARDPLRGFDHGTYSLLKAIYPGATIPVVQLSLRMPLDPGEHLSVGRALTPLRDEGVLILGSGQSFHNLQLRGAQARQASESFDTWLRQSVLSDAKTRTMALLDWESAPNAHSAHPHADHLMPLHVVAGAAGTDAATCVFGDWIADLATSAYGFGAQPEASAFDVLRFHERAEHSPTRAISPTSLMQPTESS